MKKSTLLILAHPDIQLSTLNIALLDTLAGLEGLTIRNLYDIYPDFQIDCKAEQEELLKHERVIFQFPFYWYNMPALLKQWFDTVLTYNFAFGRNAQLKNQIWTASVTVGGAFEDYQHGALHQYTVQELLKPIELTANYCSQQYSEPFVFHSVPEGELEKAAAPYREFVERLQA